MTGILPLDDALAAFLEGGRSITLASRDVLLHPFVARAVACRVAADRRSLVVLLPRSQALPLFEHLADNGQLAAVFSEPSSHRTFQLKGHDAHEIAADGDDQAAASGQLDRLIAELIGLGFDEATLRTCFACAADDLAAIRFTPAEAYSQTPGPRAGAPLEPRP